MSEKGLVDDFIFLTIIDIVVESNCFNKLG
jgi:hypothetical protein